MEQKEQAGIHRTAAKIFFYGTAHRFLQCKKPTGRPGHCARRFLSACLQSVPQFDSEEHEKAWLIRVTINRCKNHVKSFWNRHTEGLSEDLSYLPEEETRRYAGGPGFATKLSKCDSSSLL